MTVDQNRLEAVAGSDDDRVAVTVHRGVHEAALHLAEHHVAAYAGQIHCSEPDHARVEELLIGVVEDDEGHLEIARLTAHKLAELLAPSMVNGHPTRFMIVVSEGPMTPDDLEAVISLLRAV